MKNYDLLNGLPNISVNHIENFLETTSASVYWKDKKGTYLGVNDTFVKVSAMHSYDDAIGKTDLDLLWHEQAPIMMENDQEIIYKSTTKTYIESAASPQNTIVHYLSHKTPLCNREGRVIGSFGFSFLIENVDSIIKALNEMSSIGYPIPFPSNKCKAVEYDFNSQSSSILTKRQIDCLYHLVRGMTMKQIAATLNLSPKTVEHYLDAIKIKLNCFSRTELITKALKMGFGR